MPTRTRRRRRPEVDAGLIQYMLRGEFPDKRRFFQDAQPTDADLRLLWKVHGPRLTPGFIEQHPGQRPATWWRLEAPEPRRIGPDGPESETTYLDRHGLLTEAERQALLEKGKP